MSRPTATLVILLTGAHEIRWPRWLRDADAPTPLHFACCSRLRAFDVRNGGVDAYNSTSASLLDGSDYHTFHLPLRPPPDLRNNGTRYTSLSQIPTTLV